MRVRRGDYAKIARSRTSVALDEARARARFAQRNHNGPHTGQSAAQTQPKEPAQTR